LEFPLIGVKMKVDPSVAGHMGQSVKTVVGKREEQVEAVLLA
jgi:hypothetical protein